MVNGPCAGLNDPISARERGRVETISDDRAAKVASQLPKGGRWRGRWHCRKEAEAIGRAGRTRMREGSLPFQWCEGRSPVRAVAKPRGREKADIERRLAETSRKICNQGRPGRE